MTKSYGATPDGLPPLRDVIKTHELNAKKSLGQNFLLDFNITRRIARFGGDLRDTTCFEVGPGPGGLTRALLIEGANQVVAVERDERCLPALADIAGHYPNRLVVHHDDALAFDWSSVGNASKTKRNIIAANLPYGIASALLVNWLESEPWPPWFDDMLLMFQKEVAERITAKPNTKAYGRLSILAQARCQVKIVMTLPPDAFTPPPKVASAVVSLKPFAARGPEASIKILGKVTAAAFGQRRKMLRASLKSLVNEPGELLDAANIKQTSRAEDLSVHQFVRLAYIYERMANQTK